MNKKRVVRLRDPKLCRIRFELRQLLIEVVQSEMLDLILRQRLLIDRNHGVRFNENQYKKLLEEENILRRDFRQFIGKCSSCSDLESDHIYNPRDKMWYCEECYEKFRKLYNSYEFYNPKAFP